MRLRRLSPKTLVVLVFDTDVLKVDILKYNIDKLMKESNVCEIYLIPQCKDFEDEIVRATSIKKIEEFIPTNSKNEFKREFIREKNLVKKLSQHHFSLNDFWSEKPEGVFAEYENQSLFVKKPRS